MPNLPGINLDLYNLVYIPLIAFLTYMITCALPEGISAKKFGPLISVVIGIAISVADGLYNTAGESIPISAAVIRGIIAAAVTNGVYDHYKSGKALVNKEKAEACTCGKDDCGS